MREKVIRIDDLDLSQQSLLLNETLFHNANGYIGVRSCFEEGYAIGLTSVRGTYINGIYDIAAMEQAEKLFGLVEEKETMLNVADTQGISLCICGETFSMFEGKVLESERILDMEQGVATRRVIWRSPGEREVEIVIHRMTSFVRKPLFLIDYQIRALNFSGEVSLISLHSMDVTNFSDQSDPRVARNTAKHLRLISAQVKGETSYIESMTSRSGITVCTGVKNVINRSCRMTSDTNRDVISCQMDIQLEVGESVTLHKYTVLTDSRRYSDCRAAAERELEQAFIAPLDTLYQEQCEYLDEFWKTAVLRIHGDNALNSAVSYNLYQLLQSAGSDRYSSIASKGLSGEGYEGHYFWDTEMYIVPFFTLTNPEITRRLLSYRHSTIEIARKNAAVLGHKKGVLFPWRTISGRECSGYFPAGTAQYHINGDIAYAAVSYWLATGAIDYLAEEGAEIIVETARLWMDLGCWYQGSFRINGVTGPDEYTCIVNNNYYTNVCARFNLRWAVKVMRLLQDAGLDHVAGRIGVTQQELEEFDVAADRMYLPFDETLGIVAQDDSFLTKPIWDVQATPQERFPLLLHYHPLNLYRHQVCKQPDTILAFMLFGCERSEETVRKSFDYYEKITTHDSSLSACIFSTVASQLNDPKKAYSYFGESAMLDLNNTHGNTKDGIHTANMGGVYMSIVYGFGGLRISEEGLSLAPMVPESWKGLSFGFAFQKSRVLVEADRFGCSCTLTEGDRVTLTLYNKKFSLDTEHPSCRAEMIVSHRM